MRNDRRIFALGFFDGVHLGHQALLRECCRLAGERSARTAAITFDRHPQSLFTQAVPPLINTASDRRRLLRQYGIGEIDTYPVTREVMATPWRDFLDGLLLRGAAGFVCGADFRFGCRGEGTAAALADRCRELDLPCVVVPDQTVDGIRVSSTHIRSLLEQGQAEEAARFLGHPHILTGRVIPGRRLGRTLGIPTANLALPPELLRPRFGVYVSTVQTPAGSYPAVTNVGTRPTVSGEGVTAESWLLDFDGDLYGREITVFFHAFLRPEEKFPTLAALQEAIRRDGVCTRDYFSTHAL